MPQLMHKSFWQPFLQNGAFVVLDGGLATELERRGANLDDPLWSAKVLIDNPDLIRQVHLDYLRAGANVITSASYQASFEGFAGHRMRESRARQFMYESIRLAETARYQYMKENPHRLRPLVAASIGCYGAVLHDGSEYRGDYGLSVQQLVDWHRPRFEILAHGRADLLACETIPCRAEAEALVRLAAEYPEKPVWLSFSCKDESRVCYGETLAECVALTRGVENIVAAGINCTPPHLVEPLLRSLVGVTDCPLLVYPNSGETWDADRRCWACADAEVQDWGQLTRNWYHAGARLIGGCCRTTPETIRQIAEQFTM
jgi:homocysteine S-methyltransferase